MTAYEVNFDGIVGPTHNYAGLAFGNVASMTHAHVPSNPREAALQGLAKMHALTKLGIKQAVLPPQERPYVLMLRQLGFTGTDASILARAQQEAPHLLISCSSAACMWTANAATVSPSADSRDGKVHFTAANMVNNFHRSLEHSNTSKTLRAIFHNAHTFVHHDPLPSTPQCGDEGAANHTRLTESYDKAGIQLFVYGRTAFGHAVAPTRFPARQTDAASQAIARLHQLDPKHVVFAQQSPEAIDAGVFHNDVISVGNLNVFLYHEQAFVNTSAVIHQLRECCDFAFFPIEVRADDVTLEEAVATYLFNSQIVLKPSGSMALIAPEECRKNARIHACIEKILADANPISEVHYFDLHQSMRNGGGPACLRLRVVLTEEELAATLPGVFLTEALYGKLVKWVHKYYRDRLLPKDLGDSELLNESRAAVDEVHKILGI